MQYTAPHYYCRFACVAGKCPDTCCAGWQIAIDKQSLKKYKKTKGLIRNRLRNEIDWKEEIFRQYNGRCAFLNEENLCDLYLEGGKEMFCRTCRTYPRHIEEFEGLKEISLSLSCPVAAKLILNLKEPVRFVTKEVAAIREEAYDDFDYFLFTKLEDSREVIFQILQNRDITIETRMAMVLALAHDLQQRVDKNALFEVDALLSRYQQKNAPEWFERKLHENAGRQSVLKQKQILKRMFDIFDGLEVLREDWGEYLENIKRTLFERKAGETDEIEEGQRIKSADGFDLAWEQLMVYFIYTYFCGAVYDQKVYVKMKFALLGTLLIREMSRALWIQNNREDGEPTALFQDLEEAARRYAKEVEHSDLNKNLVEERLDNELKFGLKDFFSIL